MPDELTTPAAPEPSDELQALRESVKKLEEKNRELKREKDAAKIAAAEAEELRRYKDATEQQKLESEGDYTTAKAKLQEQYDRDIKALKDRIEELEAKIRDLELITPAASVLATLVHDPDDVFKTGRLKAEQIEPGPNGPVVVNGLERIPLADWAQANLPRHYLKAPAPRGSGAPPSRGSGAPGLASVGADPDLAFFVDGNVTEMHRIYKTDPTRYAALQAAAKGAAS